MSKTSRFAEILPSRGDIGLQRIVSAIDVWISRGEKSHIIDLCSALPDDDRSRVERIVEASVSGAVFYNQGKRRKLKIEGANPQPTQVLLEIRRAASKELSFRSREVEKLVWRPAPAVKTETSYDVEAAVFRVLRRAEADGVRHEIVRELEACRRRISDIKRFYGEE